MRVCDTSTSTFRHFIMSSFCHHFVITLPCVTLYYLTTIPPSPAPPPTIIRIALLCGCFTLFWYSVKMVLTLNSHTQAHTSRTMIHTAWLCGCFALLLVQRKNDIDTHLHHITYTHSAHTAHSAPTIRIAWLCGCFALLLVQRKNEIDTHLHTQRIHTAHI